IEFGLKTPNNAPAGQINDYEASKLQIIKLDIIEGDVITPNSPVFASYTEVNRAPIDQPNNNTLKRDFYDNKIVLDETNFGKTKDEFRGRLYTLRLSVVNDYVTPKPNPYEVPVDEETFVFTTVSSIPSVPTPNDSIIVVPIRNRELPTNEIKPELGSEAIVRYAVRSKFDNSSLTLRNITYTPILHSITGTQIELTNLSKTTQQAGNSVNLETIFFDVENGEDVRDPNDAIRRGYTYSFKYVAQLDLNDDGAPETTLPLDPNDKFVSLSNTLHKDIPRVTAYSVNRQPGSFTFKFKPNDYDRFINPTSLNISIGGVNSSIPYPTTVDPNGFMSVTVPNLRTGNFSVSASGTTVLGNNSFSRQETLFEYNFIDTTKTPNTELSFDAEVLDNKLEITVGNMSANNDIFDRIVNLSITIDSVSGAVPSLTMDNLTLDINNKIIIPLLSISQFDGERVEISIDALYDQDQLVYDTITSIPDPNKGYILLVFNDVKGKYEYLSKNRNGDLVRSDKATDSLFKNVVKTVNSQTSGGFLEFSNDIGSNRNYIYDYSYGFINLNGIFNTSAVQNKLIIKEISRTSIDVGLTSSNQVSINYISPSISDANFVVGLVDAEFNFMVDTSTQTTPLINNRVYVEVYENISGNIVNTFNVDNINANGSTLALASITGLIPATEYVVRVSGDFDTTNGVSREYLYDDDARVNGRNYRFNTLSVINIGSNFFTHNVVSISPTVKAARFNFDVPSPASIAEIRYEVYDIANLTTPLNLAIMPDIAPISGSTSKNININFAENFYLGNRYRLVVKAYVNSPTGLDEVATRDYDFTLRTLFSPISNVSAIPSSSELDLRVTVGDSEMTISNGEYSISIYN
ncbi:MAG: hypothetical protein ACRCZK_05165, partial [Oscillospiraceae bacterium]